MNDAVEEAYNNTSTREQPQSTDKYLIVHRNVVICSARTSCHTKNTTNVYV